MYVCIYTCIIGIYHIIGGKQMQRSSTFMAAFGIKNVKGISVAAMMAVTAVMVVMVVVVVV